MPTLDKSPLTYQNYTNVLHDFSKRSLFYTVFMSFFCSVLTTEHLITILLNPGAQERAELFVYAIFFYIPIFSFYSIGATFKLNKLINNAFLMKICIIWFYFILFRIVQGFISDSNIDFYGLFSQFLFFYIGCTFAESINRTKWPLFLILTFLMSTAITVYFCYSIYSSNAYSLVGLMYINDVRPQHEYDLIQSTELSNYCAHIFIIGFGLVISRELSVHYKKYLIPICIISPMILFFICYLFSTATLIGLLLVTLFLVIRKQSYFQILFYIIFITFVATIIYFSEWYQFFQDLFYYKSSATDRKFIYSTLIELISENPFWGIGRGKFFDMYEVFPHQNFLGTWAEGGLFLLLFYAGLIILIISLYTRLRKHLVDSSDRLILEVAFSILLFWHFKGLVQDTWNNINLYFWTGIITGVYLNSKTSIKTGFQHRFLSVTPS